MGKERISIIGTGHVGLVTAICFANKGYNVITSTRNAEKAKLLSKGIPPFHEEGLEGSLKSAISSGKLSITLSRDEAVAGSDVTFITVATPSKPDGSIDLSFTKEASLDIGKALGKKAAHHLVVMKSTVIPGTVEGVVKPAIEKASGKKAGIDFGLCTNPEFLREGSAVYDTLHPDRVVIGELDGKSGETLEELYRGFYGKDLPPVVRTNIPTAEMIKYASNAFLATKISFINQIANLCELVPGVDVRDVAKGVGLDHRINPKFLRAGAGFGGSCFPKDVKALIDFAKGMDYDPALLRDVLSVNEEQANHVVDMLKERLASLDGKRIAILGLAFKPGTDDMREAPSIRIINRILSEGAEVVAYDPIAIENAKRVLGDKVTYATSAEECLEGTEGCIVVTEWDEFKRIDPERFKELMKRPVVIDARRIYDPEKFSKVVDYSAVGLGKAS